MEKQSTTYLNSQFIGIYWFHPNVLTNSLYETVYMIAATTKSIDCCTLGFESKLDSRAANITMPKNQIIAENIAPDTK